MNRMKQILEGNDIELLLNEVISNVFQCQYVIFFHYLHIKSNCIMLAIDPAFDKLKAEAIVF